MNEVIEALKYSRDGRSGGVEIENPLASITGNGALNPSTLYPSIKEMMATCNGDIGNGPVTPRAAFEVFTRGSCRGRRLNLFASTSGSDGSTAASEDVYLVTGCSLNPTVNTGVKLEKIGTITWTSGAEAVSSALGGRANHKWAKGAGFVTTGLLAARIGLDAQAVNGAGAASVTIPDAPNAIGVLRVGTVTGYELALMSERWA